MLGFGKCNSDKCHCSRCTEAKREAQVDNHLDRIDQRLDRVEHVTGIQPHRYNTTRDYMRRQISEVARSDLLGKNVAHKILHEYGCGAASISEVPVSCYHDVIVAAREELKRSRADHLVGCEGAARSREIFATKRKEYQSAAVLLHTSADGNTYRGTPGNPGTVWRWRIVRVTSPNEHGTRYVHWQRWDMTRSMFFGIRLIRPRSFPPTTASGDDNLPDLHEGTPHLGGSYLPEREHTITETARIGQIEKTIVVDNPTATDRKWLESKFGNHAEPEDIPEFIVDLPAGADAVMHDYGINSGKPPQQFTPQPKESTTMSPDQIALLLLVHENHEGYSRFSTQIQPLIGRGMIEYDVAVRPTLHVTEKGFVYISALCATKLPVQAKPVWEVPGR